MKSVGLITSWRDNYGSVLQCYATRTYVEKQGYHCDVLYEENKGIERYQHYVKRFLFLGSRMIQFPELFKKYKIMKNNAIHSSNKIRKESLNQIKSFTDEYLQPKGCGYKLLKILAHSDEYVRFIAGSDQIWNSQEPINPVCFLSFAPNEKKIALAPSFGAGSVARFNRRDLKKYISNFSMLSIREEQGVEIIREVAQKEALRLADPTILLTADEWREFSKNGIALQDEYILLHFLDKPNEKVLRFIKDMQEKKKYKVVVFAYAHEEFSIIENVKILDGALQDYVSLIDNATLICTDSFHTTLFSIYFEKYFYTFERSYGNVISQSSRIENLLRRYNYERRYIKNDGGFEAEFNNLKMIETKDIINLERKRITKYLSEVLPKEKMNGYLPKLKGIDSCTGCGACISICPKKAISFETDNKFDYSIPKIEEAKCVKCGWCEKTCQSSKIVHVEEKKAYIAYSCDEELRQLSASGGVFSALASYIIQQGGIVYGACIEFSGNEVHVFHKKAESYEELKPILNSKYVQSSVVQSFQEVKGDLEKGRLVLFSGTSCQVQALYAYLGDKNRDNLYTVDLVCHGVPGERMFQKYIAYLEKEHDALIEEFSFRTKNISDSFYVLTYTISHKDGRKETIHRPIKDSGYYRMFMAGEIYRESCYRCQFANLNKPADITLGDYYEAKEDYPELFDGSKGNLRMDKGISCLLVNNTQGQKLIDLAKEYLHMYQVNCKKVQSSHPQLQKPQMYSKDRFIYFDMYKRYGYRHIEKYIQRRDFTKKIIKKLLHK